VRSVVEFGCGDGNQLASLVIEDYLGVDVSAEAVARCRTRFAGVAGRAFVLSDAYDGSQTRDAALSLDVVYHLTEDAVFEAYMQRLFAAASKVVVVYSSNHEDEPRRAAAHVRHREFTRWVTAHAPGWRLQRHIPNEFPYKGDYRQGSFADFHVFVRAG
jgi:cyclopropane fatty-acyl-phospholipid synthase-like methyltransferase